MCSKTMPGCTLAVEYDTKHFMQLARLFTPYAVDFSAFERLGPGSMRRKITRLLTQGVLMDMGKLEEFCHDNIGNYTFLVCRQSPGHMNLLPCRLRYPSSRLCRKLTTARTVLSTSRSRPGATMRCRGSSTTSQPLMWCVSV
jgi:hypothetical protein